MAKIVKPVGTTPNLIGDSGKCIDPFAALVMQEALEYCLSIANRKLDSITKIFPKIIKMETAQKLGMIGVINNTLKKYPRCTPDILPPLVPNWEEPPRTEPQAKAPRPVMVPKVKTTEPEKKKEEPVKEPEKKKVEKPLPPKTPDWMPKGGIAVVKNMKGEIIGVSDDRGRYNPPDLKQETLDAIYAMFNPSVKEKLEIQKLWLDYYVKQQLTAVSPEIPPGAVKLPPSGTSPGTSTEASQPKEAIAENVTSAVQGPEKTEEREVSVSGETHKITKKGPFRIQDLTRELNRAQRNPTGDYIVKLLFPGETVETEVRLTDDPAKVDPNETPPVWLKTEAIAQRILSKNPGDTYKVGKNTVLIREIKKVT